MQDQSAKTETHNLFTEHYFQGNGVSFQEKKHIFGIRYFITSNAHRDLGVFHMQWQTFIYL